MDKATELVLKWYEQSDSDTENEDDNDDNDDENNNNNNNDDYNNARVNNNNVNNEEYDNSSEESKDLFKKIIMEQSSDINIEGLKRERDRLKKELEKIEAQIISIPNISSKLIGRKKNYLINNVKKKYDIKNNFYFYPAQFWEHKNHIIILKCIQKLKKKGINLYFIFCGRDKGNLKFIRKKISEYKINSNIKILNYIEDEDVWALYKLSKALVMPTYFGPTNIPPVEAGSLNVPVIYSSYLKNHGKNAALYFDPDSEDDLIKALKDLDSIKLKKKLLIAGKRRLIEIQNERKKSIILFIDIISKKFIL
jgi:glycosyltransferase involved in cell wall biosynthesis